MQAGDDDGDREPWERQPSEPALLWRLFQEFLSTNPRSLRVALGRVWRLDGREPPPRVPGHIQRGAVRWRFNERREAFLAHVAEQERAVFLEARRAARKRRREQLDRASNLLGARLEGMRERDLKTMQPHRLIESLIKVHVAEREELGEDRTEDRPSGDLPSLESRIKPQDSPEET